MAAKRPLKRFGVEIQIESCFWGETLVWNRWYHREKSRDQAMSAAAKTWAWCKDRLTLTRIER